MVIIKRIKNLLNDHKKNRKEVEIIDAINEIKQKKFRYAIMNKENKRIVYSSRTYYPSIHICFKHANDLIESVFKAEYDKYKLLYYPVLIDDELNGKYEICESGIENI